MFGWVRPYCGRAWHALLVPLAAAIATSEARAEPTPAGPSKQLVVQSEDPTTGIQGRIVDRKTGLGLELARVFATDNRGTRSATTVEHGRYELKLPPGVYEVRAYYDTYHGARLNHVRVQRGRLSEVNLLLDRLADEEVAVEETEIPYRADRTTADAQGELHEASSGIGEALGATHMSQAGASDAGNAARRGGVSSADSSPIIRGLGGRYARMRLHGDPLPSTDPDRPSLDLDRFPTRVIDSLTVSKTFLPAMPADFAGGVLELKTVTFPKRLTFEVGLSGEYSSKTSFRDYLTYRGGSLDMLGFDDGTRTLPRTIDNVPVVISRTGRYRSFDDLEAIGESFPNEWRYRRASAAPSPGVDVALGDSFKLPGRKRFGYMASASYDYRLRRVTGYSRKLGIKANGEPNELVISDNYPTVELGSEDIQLSGIGTAAFDVGTDHSLRLLSLYNRSGSDDTGYRFGKSAHIDEGADVERWQLRYVGRTLWFNQLQGDHRNLFDTPLRLRWGLFYSLVDRDEPDRRNVTYLQTSQEPYELSWRSGDATRFYSSFSGHDYGGRLGLRVPLWADAFTSLGGSVRAADRSFWTRTFRFVKVDGAADDSVYAQPPEVLFSQDNLGRITRLDDEPTRAVDSFIAKQTTYAGYLMFEMRVAGPLSFTGGARAELYKQRMQPNSPFAGAIDRTDPDADTGTDTGTDTKNADRSDFNILPAAAFKYDLGGGMLLRAAYGMTVSRPHVRELAPFLYYDFLRDRNFSGDLGLRTTLIHNGDLRWQWFFGAGQELSASVFYKHFRRPIEQQVISTDGTSKFSNTPLAQTYGAELELRSSFAQLSRSLKLLEFGANVTLVRSQVDNPAEPAGAARAGSRRMYGQAPYVIHVMLRFVEPATDFSSSLVYHVVGPRIVDVGLRTGDAILPDVEQQPFHALDLITSWQATQHLKLKLEWKNILFQSSRIQQGSITTLRTNPGTFVSVGLDYSY